MVECSVTMTGGEMSVEAMALLDVDVLNPEKMPHRFGGWLKQSFDDSAIRALLTREGDKRMSLVEGRFQYLVRMEDLSTGRFHALRMRGEKSARGAAHAASAPSGSGPCKRVRRRKDPR